MLKEEKIEGKVVQVKDLMKTVDVTSPQHLRR